MLRSTSIFITQEFLANVALLFSHNNVYSHLISCRELGTMNQSRWLSEKEPLRPSLAALKDMVLSRLTLQYLR